MKQKKLQMKANKVADYSCVCFDKQDYERLIKHPAIELMRLLPHTKTYSLMGLLQEVFEEVFDAGYEAGVSDSTMILKDKVLVAVENIE